MSTHTISKFLALFGLAFVLVASVLWIVFDIQFCNDLIGKVFFKNLRVGINKLSNLGEVYKHQTLSEHEHKESYHALLRVIKKNAANIDYKRVKQIESKSVLEYTTTPQTKPLIQLISPPVTFLGETMDEDQPVTNIDILKIWATNYEKSKFLIIVLGLFIFGSVLQFVSVILTK